MLDDDLEDDEEDEGEQDCPLCGEECFDNDDGGHLLATLGRDPMEGQYGAGIHGGTLYDVEEIGELFDRVGEEVGDTLDRGEDPTRAKFSWLGEHRATLLPYVRHLAATHVPEADLPQFTSRYQAIRYNMEGQLETLQEVLAELIGHLKSDNVESTDWTFEGGPGLSFCDDLWWCRHPKATAQALRESLRELLDTPSS
tara:strand:+ start:138 stop:731 length:594 start_codon:yes stop_codon:yes gene_type:complete